MGRATWAVGGLAIVAVLIVTSSSAGATSPPFLARPSYAAYGGLALVGHSSATGTGTGYNRIGVAPAFNVTTGDDRQGQSSLAVRSGAFGIDVHSGLQNLSFVCGSGCANGTFLVTVDWNATWYGHLNSSCAGNASGTLVLAAVALGIQASVVDVTTRTTAGTTLLTLYSHSLLARGSASDRKTAATYLIKFNATLTKGNSYTFLTDFEAYTYAKANAAATSVCGSGAIARVGVARASVLEWAKVP